ncbi:MAG: universal stress protein [Pirellulales bacterium]|nr:universal stress protein [Pirellulales bacterium]
MNAKKILFPTDFSTSSDAGLQHATVLARESGATLLIVHVEEPPLAYGGGEMYYGVPNPDHAAIAEMLKAVVPTSPEVHYEHRLVVGEPAAEIVQLAEKEGVDLIVMGTHGRTGLKRMLMGSVAEAVVRHAPCPVFTLKESIPKAATA